MMLDKSVEKEYKPVKGIDKESKYVELTPKYCSRSEGEECGFYHCVLSHLVFITHWVRKKVFYSSVDCSGFLLYMCFPTIDTPHTSHMSGM